MEDNTWTVTENMSGVKISTNSGVMEVSQESWNIHYTRPATMFAGVAACLFTIIGLTGNLLTVIALCRCVKLRTHATTAFVISLAISDLLFCSINLPLTASRYIHEEWLLGETMCRLYPFFFYGNVGASLINMVAITINRYVLISCPGSYSRIYSRLNILFMISGVWIFSFGLLFPPLLELWGSLGLDPSTFSCTILRDENGRSPKKFLFLFGFLLPCIAIIVCYSAIFYRVRQSRLNVQKHMAASGPNTQTSLQSNQRREDIRMTKMMLMIFLSFLICFLPLMLVNVLDDDVKYPSLHVIGSVLAWASAVINPFIYAFKNRQYKLAFKKLLGLEKHGGQVAGRPGGSQASGHSKQSHSKTLVTEMIQLQSHTDKLPKVTEEIVKIEN